MRPTKRENENLSRDRDTIETGDFLNGIIDALIITLEDINLLIVEETEHAIHRINCPTVFRH